MGPIVDNSSVHAVGGLVLIDALGVHLAEYPDVLHGVHLGVQRTVYHRQQGYGDKSDHEYQDAKFASGIDHQYHHQDYGDLALEYRRSQAAELLDLIGYQRGVGHLAVDSVPLVEQFLRNVILPFQIHGPQQSVFP